MIKENKSQSRIQLAMSVFGRNRLAVICLWVLFVFYALALGADFFCPYPYALENRELSYCPPTSIEWRYNGQWVYPFVYGRHLSFDAMHRRQYQLNPKERYPLEFFKDGRLWTVALPGRIYIWGADARGRDIFSRIWYGARISLSIGLFGVAISFILGLVIGGIAGYFGGWLDNVLMRICEMLMMIPGFYLMLALRAVVPENFNSVQVYISVVLILAFINWASLARIIRGMTLSLREREYVQAARTMRIPDLVIILKHILPQTISFSWSSLMLSLSAYILAEAGLSMIGLGIQDPIPSWGNLLSEAMGIVPVIFAPWLLLPGVFIFLAVLSYNIIGEALRDAFDPLLN